MDDKDINSIVQIPELEDLSETIINDLKESNFVISGFKNGRPFKTLLMLFLQVVIELYGLLKSIVPKIYASNAEGVWLDAKAADNSVYRKQAVKLKGLITCSRATSGTIVSIPQGTIFQTQLDAKGVRKRYISTTQIIMQKAELQTLVPVEAEDVGNEYNMIQGTITESFQYLSGIDSITNASGWITLEGSDAEDDESLRDRLLRVWNNLALQPTSGVYYTAATNVAGVLNVIVDDMHPRGQATVDVIITSVNGIPSPELIEKVTESVNDVKGSYDDVIVYAPTTDIVNVDITLTIDKLYGDEEKIRAEAENVITNMFKVSKSNNANEFIKAVLISNLMKIDNIKNVSIVSPVADIAVNVRHILVPGIINQTIVKL